MKKGIVDGETWAGSGELRETWVNGENVRKYSNNNDIYILFSLLSPIHPYLSLAVFSLPFSCVCGVGVKRGNVSGERCRGVIARQYGQHAIGTPPAMGHLPAMGTVKHKVFVGCRRKSA